MAPYTQNEKSTGLENKATPASTDLVIMGDVADSGRAKKVTLSNFITALTNLLNAITGANKVNATGLDTTAGILDDKILIKSTDATVSVTKSLQNAGANEKIIYDLSVVGGGGSGGGGGFTFVDANAFSGTSPTTFTDLDLSSIIGAKQALVMLRVSEPSGQVTALTFKTKGETASYDPANGLSVGLSQLYLHSSGADDTSTTIVKTDANGVIQWYGIDARTVTIDVIAYSGIANITSIIPIADFPSNSLATPTLNTNTLFRAGKFIINEAITVTQVSIACDAVNTAGTVKFALFSEDGQTQIFSGETASISAQGIVTTTISAVTVSPGVYYFACLPVGTADLTLFAWTTTTGARYLTDAPTNVYTGTKTVTASTMPATFAPSSLTGNNSGGVYFRLDA